MKFRRGRKPETAIWVLVAGVVLTGAAAFAVSRLLRAPSIVRRRDLRALEKRVVHALRQDSVAGGQAIDVAALGSGAVELSGMVYTHEDARRVVALVDGVEGVRAVLNRLEIRSVESRLNENRSRPRTAAATRWYGGTVGIGRRRQSYTTDPARPDDHVTLLSRALEPNRDDTLKDVEEQEGTGVRIGVSRAGSLTTDIAPPSPERSTDAPGPPPPAETAQPQ